MQRAFLLFLLVVSALPFSNTALADSIYGPVKTGDSLWVISKDHRPASGITINQMMVATFRKNPDAFGGNINWLYVDRSLTLPTSAEARAILAADADAEVMRQNEAWKNAVDRFVAADGNRRQQLNTILSGQRSDDPELQALREELRLLVAGLKEERELLRHDRQAQQAPQKVGPGLAEFFDPDFWDVGVALGHSLISPIQKSRAAPEDNVHYQYLSSDYDSGGSLLTIGAYLRRPLWGGLENFNLSLGVEYAMIRGHGQLHTEFTHPTNAGGIPPGHYDQRFRRDIDITLIRLPVLLDTIVFVSNGIEFIAGGGVVINQTLDVDVTYNRVRTNLETGETTHENGPAHPIYKAATSEGISYDLRLLAGAQWRPDWTGGRPLLLAAELEQSIGDALGATEVDSNIVQIEKLRFLLKLGLTF